MTNSKTIIITGASSGLGAGMAREFAARGYHLGLCARRTDRLEALRDELVKAHGIRVELIALDVNDHPQVFAVFDEFKKRFGQNPDVYGPFYYDQTMNIGEAMQKSGSIDPAKVGDWMRHNPYKGVLGEYGYDDKGNRLKAPTVVNTFKNGKPMALSSQ